MNVLAARERRSMSIEIAPYDPAWPTALEPEVARVREALGAIALRITDFIEQVIATALAAGYPRR